jgi:hypothetical protein
LILWFLAFRGFPLSFFVFVSFVLAFFFYFFLSFFVCFIFCVVFLSQDRPCLSCQKVVLAGTLPNPVKPAKKSQIP